MIYDDDIGGGPVSALLGDNPGWLGGGVRDSGFVSREIMLAGLEAMMAPASPELMQEIEEYDRQQFREDVDQWGRVLSEVMGMGFDKGKK